MAITKPFHRICRPFVGRGHAYEIGDIEYVRHPKFAKDASQYVRAFLLLQKGIQELVEYIEPSDNNNGCHSFRVHVLLMRLCIELEANFTAILNENGYTKKILP